MVVNDKFSLIAVRVTATNLLPIAFNLACYFISFLLDPGLLNPLSGPLTEFLLNDSCMDKLSKLMIGDALSTIEPIFHLYSGKIHLILLFFNVQFRPDF